MKKHLLTWNCSPGQCGPSARKNIDDAQFIIEMIAWLKENCKFNHNRIFCTGFSNGGMMCYRLASHPEASKLIRAIAPVGGVTFYPTQFPSM